MCEYVIITHRKVCETWNSKSVPIQTSLVPVYTHTVGGSELVELRITTMSLIPQGIGNYTNIKTVQLKD